MKQICLRGHDTAICGRDKIGHCIDCNKRHTKNSNWKIRGIINADGSVFTTLDYDRNYQIQQGKCKICGKHSTEFKNNLHTDHDHETGLFRGLLCAVCNAKVGWLENYSEEIKSYLGTI